jgi:putative endonuclease
VPGRRNIGADGEAVVAHHYERLGWAVVDRNWRCREGEIDLVVARGSTVAFCEVKTRSSDRFGSAAEAVGWAKQRRIRALAARWLREHHVHPPVVRFDVAAVRASGRGYSVDLIEGAF